MRTGVRRKRLEMEAVVHSSLLQRAFS
jgi:hypothetical protein